MAEFNHGSRIYGDYAFAVPNEGRAVALGGKQLTAFGGYMAEGRIDELLRADRESLKRAAAVVKALHGPTRSLGAAGQRHRAVNSQ